MTTIAHQGVGVPMSQSQSSSPDNGRDHEVEVPPGLREDLTETPSDPAPDLIADAATDTVDLDRGTDPDQLSEGGPPADSATSGPAVLDAADVDAADPSDLDPSGSDSPDLDPPSTGTADAADTDDDKVSDHTGPLGRVLSFRRPRVEPDRGQLIELYQSQRLRLTRMAILLVDDMTSAEDVVQDAFVELHRRWDTLIDKDSAIGYLRISVINKARSALRRRRTARAYSPPVERAHDQAAEAVVLAEEHREVLAAIKRLPPRQREILVLRYWSDMTEAEIANTLGISRGAVKSTASRALDAMERMLEGKK